LTAARVLFDQEQAKKAAAQAAADAEPTDVEVEAR